MLSTGQGRQEPFDPLEIGFCIYTGFRRMKGTNHVDLCAMPECPQLFQ